MIKGYPGRKGSAGMVQFLINNIPYHTHYYELFAGSAVLFYTKLPAAHNLLNDINPEVAAIYQRLANQRNDLMAYSLPALAILQDVSFIKNDNTFIYADPPYPFSARRSQDKLYEYEMSDGDHVQLLLSLRETPAKVMISTRQNRLYAEMLADWRRAEFQCMGRAGPVTELVYMNYPPPQLLHQYDYLGNGYVDRQRIKRKVHRFHNKINELPDYERHALIQEMIKTDKAAVLHFLASTDKNVYTAR